MRKAILGSLFCLLLFCFGTTAWAAEKQLPYYISVDLTDNIVTVYEADDTGAYTVPIKAFYCSGGTDTPEGTFQTSQKYEWRALFGEVWGQYATRITGHYLFHSVPYLEQDKSTLEYQEYEKLGKTASAGCIRLAVKDSKWIYDHCPIGTTVKMYRGGAEEPLQPAAVEKLNMSDVERRGWDPTDPDEKNPWRKGELRELALEPSLLGSTVQAYHERNTYYLDATGAETVFSHLKEKLSLHGEAEKVQEDSISCLLNGKEVTVSCRVKDGTVYYKLRDLINLTGLEMEWDNEKRQITLKADGQTVMLSEAPVVSVVHQEKSLPMKLAALLLKQE